MTEPNPSPDDSRQPPARVEPVVRVAGDASELRRRVIVAGYGPVGRVVAEQLTRDGVSVKVIELNLSTIERQLNLDKSVIYGDVCDPKILERAGIHEAEALVVTIPDAQAALRACRVARSLAPKIVIALRVNHLSEGLEAKQAGADEVIVEELVTAQAMRDAVCSRLRPPDGGGAT